jgi:hypothetical protein
MSHLRTLKINNITNSNDRTNNLKNKTLYNSIRRSGVKEGGVDYEPNKITDDCLISAESYETYIGLAKGQNLCNPPDISYSLQGQMNESNLILVDTRDMSLCLPVRDFSGGWVDGSGNTISYPLSLACDCDIFQNPGVLVDPSNVLVNAVSCYPYIRELNDASNSQLIYDLSNTGGIVGSGSYYERINKANNQLELFYLSSKIKFA